MSPGWGGGSDVVRVLVEINLLIGVLAILLALTPGPARGVRAWVAHIEVDGTAAPADHDIMTVAVRSSSNRASLHAVVILAVVTVAAAGLGLRAQAPALALATALALAALTPGDMSTRRRASLVPTPGTAASAASAAVSSGFERPSWLRSWMWVGLPAVAVTVLAVALQMATPWEGAGVETSTGWAPRHEQYTWPLMAAASLALAAALIWGTRHLRLRRQPSLLSSSIDTALRAIALRRLRASVGAGQLVLLGSLISVLPAAAAYDPSRAVGEVVVPESAKIAGSVIALLATGSALALLVISHASPWWTRLTSSALRHLQGRGGARGGHSGWRRRALTDE